MKSLKKYSFTLIELIIAIIIIGIVVTAIPALLSSVIKTQSITSKEKYFFNAFSLVTLIKTVEWDENNTKDDNYYKVLTSNGGDTELVCPRDGVIELNNSSGADCDDNTTSHIGIDSGEDENNVSTFDDVDDFNNYSTLVNDMNISVSVHYVDDETDYTKKDIFFNEESDDDDSNIKKIKITITDKKGKEIGILKYFTSNIGMVKIESRNE